MKSHALIKLISCLLVLSIALSTRAYAVARYDLDFDEPVYLENALEFTNYLRDGRYSMLAWSETVYEHPALYKVIYSVALLSLPRLDKLYEKDAPMMAPIQMVPASDWVRLGRYISAGFGALAALVLSLVAPPAGLFLALHSLSIKYTSQFYIEALPLLTSLLCGLAYLKWYELAAARRAAERRAVLWLALSALCLGLTAAGKYVYCIVGLAVVVHFCAAALQRKLAWRSLLYLAAWGSAALLFFLLFNPYLWPHPLERLLKTIVFHLNYKESAHVESYHYPFWQPLVWLSRFSTLEDFHQRAALLFKLDPLIFGLACLGLPRLFSHRRFFFYWLLIGMLMLLVWDTKWPQYGLIVLAPLSMSAAEGFYLFKNLIVARLPGRAGASR